MTRRLALVVNPTAGGGRAQRLLPRVVEALAAYDVTVSPTRSLEHCDELVGAALADGRVVAAMGGDGLVGRAAGVVARGGGLLAVLPGGRGNDFARSVGVGRDPVAACRLLADGQERRVDLGQVVSASGTQTFLGIASVGFDSAVQERALRTRVPLGSAVYLVSALATVASWRAATFTGTVDGAPYEHHGWSVAVADSGTYGGGMRLAPGASVEDGALDVVRIGATTRRHFLRVLPQVFRGTHVTDPCVSLERAREVVVDADRPFRVFADGDPVGVLPCTVTVLPAALRVLLPPVQG